jgi:hypothetical protein
MTTQVEVTKSSQTIQAPSQIKKPIWPFVLAILLTLFLISAAILVISPAEAVSSGNQRALEAMTARYQGLAEMQARNEAALERGWQASAARYQGLADLQAKPISSPALEAMTARYQGLAEMQARNEAALERGWQASTARYQALAEYYQARDQ